MTLLLFCYYVENIRSAFLWWRISSINALVVAFYTLVEL